GARFYHRAVTTLGVLTFIFAHDSDASQSLYTMVRTFYDTSRDEKFKPRLGASNAKELLFPGIKSGYKVGSAGTQGLGRSRTFQQVHWSEVAYSPKADEHASGIMQTVSDVDGTEIILESTADGQGNFFHRHCVQAMSGDGDYELIFIPWYWQDEYKREISKLFHLEQSKENQDYSSEQEYYDTFKKDGLTLEHLAWRRSKILDGFQGDIERFQREYPFSPEEAFVSSAAESFIKPMLIERAARTQPIQTSAPLVFGVDPARMGGDKFKVHHRKGRNSVRHEVYPPMRLDQSATRLAQDINKHKPAVVNIDAGGLGVGLYDALVGMGYGHIVNKVDFGATALNPDLNKDMTAEMFRQAREWLEDMPCSMSLLKHKDVTAIQSQLSARRYDWHRNSILAMESKKKFKEEYNFSPDDADAFLLTFAKPLAPSNQGRRLTETYVASTDWSPFT
ncbi:hypothetical protein KAR91_36120, partial [Candidatus Pacearchaeota archaeon]|nr:hypothetical protein [Candidatus Pacearchaeota archaeon]